MTSKNSFIKVVRKNCITQTEHKAELVGECPHNSVSSQNSQFSMLVCLQPGKCIFISLIKTNIYRR